MSIASDATQANADTARPMLSGDGRYITYTSGASNLVPGDANAVADVFLHDRQAAMTTRVSVAYDGTEANGTSSAPAISGDGRYITYTSDASNLVPGDTNGTVDVFLYDRQTAATARLSVAAGGAESNGYSLEPSISGDGRYIAYMSYASNLVPGDTNNAADEFLYDRQTAVTVRVSVAYDGTEVNNSSFEPAISGDGRYITYTSDGSNLVPGDTNGVADVFVFDRQTALTTRVSVASDGAQANGYGGYGSYGPAISADGRYVTYQSGSTNLVPDDTNYRGDVFVHDRQSAVTTRVSVTSDGSENTRSSDVPAISADGRYVTYMLHKSNLVPDNTNIVFLHDRQTAATTLVSLASDGTAANGDSDIPDISGDGRFVTYMSRASNLVPGDTNGNRDVFVFAR